MNLLVFKVNQLGDNVVFVSVVQELRRRRPGADLTVFTTSLGAPLYATSASRVHVHERAEFNGSWRRPAALARLVRETRAAHAHAALVSFDQGSVAHALARISGAPIRVGSAELDIRFPPGLTRRVSYRGGSIAAWNWEMGRVLAEACGVGDWPAQMPRPDLSHLTREPVPPKTKPRLVLHAGGSLPYRLWPRDRYLAAARALAADFEVVWIVRPETAGDLPPGVMAATCDTLPALASWLASGDVFLGNNSGPMHLAAALGLSGVVISGPSHPQWDPTWAGGDWRVLRASGIACLPCESPKGFPGKCANRGAPLCCLLHWPVERVVEVCRELFARAATR